MKSPKQPSKKPSMPVLFQSFGLTQNLKSNYSSRVRSKKRPAEVGSPIPSSQCESNFRLAIKSSRKHFQPEQTAIQQHFENMQKILLSQNLNLKQQNVFLTSQIRKSIKNEQKLKDHKRNAALQLKKLNQDIHNMQTELNNSKSLVEHQLFYLSQGIKSNNLQQIKNIIVRCIDSIAAQFQIQVTHILPRNIQQTSIDRPLQLQTGMSEVDQEIDFLTKKLQKLLEEDHSPTKGTTVRRQCIQLSKQIKQLKQKSRSASNITHQAYDNLPSNCPRSSLQSSISAIKDSATMKQPFWHSEVLNNKRPESKNNVKNERYSNSTRRKSLNRQNSSYVQTPVFTNTSQHNFK